MEASAMVPEVTGLPQASRPGDRQPHETGRLPDLPGGAMPPGTFSGVSLGPNEKICMWCGMHYFRKPHRPQKTWDVQIFCSIKCKCSWNAHLTAVKAEARHGAREKQCIICKSTFHKTHDIGWKKWKTRLTCSVACSNTQRRLLATETSGIPEEKVCPHCGATFRRPVALDRGSWNKRIFCSPLCRSQSTAAAAAATPPKMCPSCERPFRRRPGEGIKKWSVRVFCSAACRCAHEPRPAAPPPPPEMPKIAFEDSERAVRDFGSRYMPPRPASHIPYAVSNWR